MFPSAARIAELRADLGTSAYLFIPELVLCGGIVLMLVLRLVKFFDRTHMGGVAVVTVAAALAAALVPFTDGSFELAVKPLPFFGGMLVNDSFALFVRPVILAAALLTLLLTRLTGLPDRDDSADFATLLLGGTLGMTLMASANHLLAVFMAVEMASLPSYALAGFLKGRRTGSEAALKYVVFGAAASGVMLYGISLLAARFGTGYLPDVARGLAAVAVPPDGFDPVLSAGAAFLLVGLGFKLAAVPFHFWCPDVFEGAAAEVAGFLSVASKAGAVALTLRLLMTAQAAVSPLDPLLAPRTLGLAVGAAAAVTVTLGNLAAFRQTNLKRMLAYSTIAHAGYMLLAVATLDVTRALRPSDPTATSGAAAVLYYLVAYLVMNLGAFAVVALVRNRTGSEDLDAYRGLAVRAPGLAVPFTLFLLALLGLPPLAGFAGKFQVFEALYEAGLATGGTELGPVFYTLLGIGAVNTALSAYYYLRVVRAMTLDDPPEQGEVAAGVPAAAYLLVLSAALVALGVWWNPVTRAAGVAVQSLTATGVRR